MNDSIDRTKDVVENIYDKLSQNKKTNIIELHHDKFI